MTTVVRRRIKRLDVYTDGACSGPQGPGGWAWAILELGIYDQGGSPRTTNQRMELQAALEGVRANPGRLCIVSDSAYLINCFEEKWYRNWTKQGVKLRDGKPVSNWDIWEPLIALVLPRDITFRKVKGHSGDQGNEYVDRLAVEAKRRFQ